ITVPAGGFVFVSNLGNNWQDLCQAYRDYLAAKEAYDKGDTAEAPTEVAEPWYWGSYKDAPNECTTEGNANYNFVKTLVEGQTARLYNINLELLTCSRDFNSYIAIDFPSVSLAYEYIDGALTLTAIDKDAYQIGAINLALNAPYRFICEVSPSYADTDGKELTDGILAPDGNCGDPAWIGLAGTDNIGNLGRYLSIIDLGETKSVAKLVGYYAHKGWGIGIPATVSFYGSEDGQTFYYIGDVETDTDAIALSDDEWKNYALELELDSTVDVRYVALCTYKGIADGFSFAFVSEFEAYGIEEIPAPIESDPGTPETGDYTPYVIAVLAMILAGSVALVIKKRRA
ncbi:MAG TPA: hypothetical protein PLT66_08680, partial [Bacillota bacterium]|nr:hypothetical protein [Bacillota bacterium]